MAMHYLKTWPEYFQAIEDGSKTFEIRWNDRKFEVGDTLILKEFVMTWDHRRGEYTGRQSMQVVTYILDGGKEGRLGIAAGYVVMGIQKRVGISETPPQTEGTKTAERLDRLVAALSPSLLTQSRN